MRGETVRETERRREEQEGERGAERLGEGERGAGRSGEERRDSERREERRGEEMR